MGVFLNEHENMSTGSESLLWGDFLCDVLHAELSEHEDLLVVLLLRWLSRAWETDTGGRAVIHWGKMICSFSSAC